MKESTIQEIGVLNKVEEAYLSLLEIPAWDSFRVKNQDIYGRLRSHIAQMTGRKDQDVQEEFEDRARGR